MSADPQTIVPSDFEFLRRERRFQVAASDTARVFDNAFVVLSSTDFDVRFVRDRGDLYIEIKPPSEGEWQDLFLVRLLVLDRDPSEDTALEELAEFLKAHYDTVKGLFAHGSQEATAAKLDKLGRERLKRMFPGRVRE